MRVKSGWCNSQVAAESVDVLDQRNIHFQGPFAAGLLGMSSVYAGAPSINVNLDSFGEKQRQKKKKHFSASTLVEH